MFVTSSRKFQQKFQFSEPAHKAKGSVCHWFSVRQKHCFSTLHEVKIFLFVNRKRTSVRPGELPAATIQKVSCQTTVYGTRSRGVQHKSHDTTGNRTDKLINYRITKQGNQPDTSLDSIWIIARANFNADYADKLHTDDHSILGHKF